MDILFENQYERTKGFYKEIFSYTFFRRPQMMALYIVLALIFILCTRLLSLLFSGLSPFDNTIVIYLSLWAIFMVFMIVGYGRTVEICYKRDLEINNGKPIEIKLILTNDGIESCRLNSETKNHISYQSFRKIISTRNYYVLSTEAENYVALKKDRFITGTPNEFLSFIEGKITKGTKKSKKQIILIFIADKVYRRRKECSPIVSVYDVDVFLHFTYILHFRRV